jgi:hypothetical protein
MDEDFINKIMSLNLNFSDYKMKYQYFVFNRERTRKTSVQSILFDKKIFKTKEQCIAWIKRQNKDFKFGKYDPPGETGKYHRFRQFDPDPKKEHRISKEPIDKGVFFIYEY